MPSLLARAALVSFLVGCGGELPVDDGTTTSSQTCYMAALTFGLGDDQGHPDPFGAKAAGQARAARIRAAQVPQPATGRQRIEDGDFLLINDVEPERVSFVGLGNSQMLYPEPKNKEQRHEYRTNRNSQIREEQQNYCGFC